MTTIQFSSGKKNNINPSVVDISCQDLKAHLAEVHVIDVRRPDEWDGELGHIKEATLITLDTLPANVAKLPKDKPLVFVCKSGGRSLNAATFALANGFTEVFNLAGGMTAWASTKDTSK